MIYRKIQIIAQTNVQYNLRISKMVWHFSGGERPASPMKVREDIQSNQIAATSDKKKSIVFHRSTSSSSKYFSAHEREHRNQHVHPKTLRNK